MYGIAPLITVIVVMILADFVVTWSTDLLGTERNHSEDEEGITRQALQLSNLISPSCY